MVVCGSFRAILKGALATNLCTNIRESGFFRISPGGLPPADFTPPGGFPVAIIA